MKFLAERAVAREGLQHRAGIGETAGFDDDPLETRHRAARPVGEQRAQTLLQIGAHRAAQAAIAEQHRRVARSPQQRVVDPDLAVFVDDDCGVGAFGAAQQLADQRRLARTEKAGHDGNRNARAARPPLAAAERTGIGGRKQFRTGRHRSNLAGHVPLSLTRCAERSQAGIYNLKLSCFDAFADSAANLQREFPCRLYSESRCEPPAAGMLLRDRDNRRQIWQNWRRCASSRHMETAQRGKRGTAPAFRQSRSERLVGRVLNAASARA